MKTTTATVDALSPGALVDIRGETWLVHTVERNAFQGGPVVIRATGTSELVRGMDAAFVSDLDTIELVRPEDTSLVPDTSGMYLNGRLHIEAVARRTPIGSSDSILYTTGRALVDDLDFQKVPVHKALTMLRPRILIADAVGLGKTIEVAILLNELAARGAANRVLAIVPQSILEQVQHELWCRTGFPLIRLDTPGIQRMRNRIPAGRNPFSFFRRVIVSIDTIKQPGRYRPFLEDVNWDVVWIDECHSLINRRSQNSELARVLSERSDGFILTSATPHNGSSESFAELISLLDPTAIADPANYDAEAISHLFVRRHRHSPEVDTAVAGNWAERIEPQVIPVTPDPPEEAIFAELTATWIRPDGTKPPCQDRLFPWTLFKAALSSPAAFAATVQGRLDRRAGTTKMDAAEEAALHRLLELAQAAIGAGPGAKFHTLVEYLSANGIAPRKKGRAVIFSERVDTLDWLRKQFIDAGRRPDEITLFHHDGLDEESRQNAVKDFGLEDSAVRLFITGDMASEGVNLHNECHVLVHWDLPWSLIRIQQRNGRIDRYGQKTSPNITALVTSPADPESSGDARIIAKLLAKEHAAHRNLGDAAAVMGEWDADAEESAIQAHLASQSTFSERAKLLDVEVPEADDDWSWTDNFGALTKILAAGGNPHGVVPSAASNRLFPDNVEFVTHVASLDGGHHDLGWRTEDTLVTFVPPEDLKRRYDILPVDLVRGLRLHEQVKVTSDQQTAARELADSRKRRLKDKELNPDKKAAAAWPEIGYLTDEHPVTAWAVDRAMTLFGRGTAPIVCAKVPSPVVLVAGSWANKQGEPLAVRWAGIEINPAGGIPEIVCTPAETFDWLADVGVAAGIPNASPAFDLNTLQGLIAPAVAVARERLAVDLDDLVEAAQSELHSTKARLDTWEAAVRARAEQASSPTEAKRLRTRADAVNHSTNNLLANRTPGTSAHVRVVALLVPVAS